jgi:hypothetical protein
MRWFGYGYSGQRGSSSLGSDCDEGKGDKNHTADRFCAHEAPGVNLSGHSGGKVTNSWDSEVLSWEFEI